MPLSPTILNPIGQGQILGQVTSTQERGAGVWCLVSTCTVVATGLHEVEVQLGMLTFVRHIQILY